MGGGVSVDVDASVLRKEYETLAAKNVSDEELLNHMKKLIVFPQTDNASTTKEAAPDVKGTRRTSGGRDSAAGGTRRGSALVSGDEVTGSALRRGSAVRPNSHNSRLSISASTQASSQQRRGSNAGRASADGDRPLSAPQTKPAVPKQRPRSSLGERNLGGGSGKPTKYRRRSYVPQPAPAVADGDAAAGNCTETIVAATDADGATPVQEVEVEKMQIDSWESVSQQPSCPLCHMVFSTEGKRDQHIKYSPAHAPPAEESGLQPARESTMNSITIYSGTKLFWRTRLNVELFMQQHELASAVQVLAFDASTNRELGQVWVSWSNVVARLDPKEMKKETEAAERAFHNLGMEPIPDKVAAEAARKAAVSFIIKRIQVDEIPVGEGVELGAPKSYDIFFNRMAADDEMNLIVDRPEGVNATFSRALIKRASIQEVDEVVTSLRKSLGDVSSAAQAAVANLDTIEGTVEQGRRGSMEVARRASIQQSS